MAHSGPFYLLVYRSVESRAGKEFKVETYSAPSQRYDQLYPTMSEKCFSKLLLESITNTVLYNGHN